MRQAEMIALVDGDRLVGNDARADTAGACQILCPVRAEVQPGLAQLILKARIAEEIDTDSLRIGQQQNVILPSDLPEQRLQA